MVEFITAPAGLSSPQMSKLCNGRVCLLCVRHQEQARGPSEGRGRPGLHASSLSHSLSLLSLSLSVTQLLQGLKEWDRQE